MQADSCKVKIVNKELITVCAVSFDDNDTVAAVKKRVAEAINKRINSFALLYNKVSLMNDTVVRSICPGTESFSLIIEYGLDVEYTFILDDGRSRRARANTFDTFATIRGIASYSTNIPLENVVIICDDFIPLLVATPQNYNYTNTYFKVLNRSPLITKSFLPDINSMLSNLNELCDLTLCFHALSFFFESDRNNFVGLTNICIITRNILMNTNSTIPSKMETLYLMMIDDMMNTTMRTDLPQNTTGSIRDERHLLLESIYSSLYIIVMRYYYMKVPVSSITFNRVLRTLQKYSSVNTSVSNYASIRGSMTFRQQQPISFDVMTSCVSILDLYCNEDNIASQPITSEITVTLIALSEQCTVTAVFACILSCLCGLCRKRECRVIIARQFPQEKVTGLIREYDGVPAVVRALFLMYSFIVEENNLIESDIYSMQFKRDQIIDMATDYLDQHGDDLQLLEAYILLVIPAYNRDFSLLPRRVALKLESALQFSEKSSVIEKWITRMLSGYFRDLSSDAIIYYKQQSNLLFIAIHDNPCDCSLIRTCIASLQVYCINRVLEIVDLRHNIISVDTMSILIDALSQNASINSKSVIPMCNFLYFILEEDTICNNYFLENHGVYRLSDCIPFLTRVEDAIKIYDILIIVFQEVSPSQLPVFSIDVFESFDRFGNITDLLQRGITVLSLFTRLEMDDPAEKTDKLVEYMWSAISSQNFSLFSIIIYVLSIMQLDQKSYEKLVSKGFFSSVFSFIREYSQNHADIADFRSCSYLSNIVCYMLQFLSFHIKSTLVISQIDMRDLLSWIDLFIEDKEIISAWLEVVNYYKVPEDTERLMVLKMISIMTIYDDADVNMMSNLTIIYRFLLRVAGTFSEDICQILTKPYLRASLFNTLQYIYSVNLKLYDVNTSGDISTSFYQPSSGDDHVICLSPKLEKKDDIPVSQHRGKLIYCINLLPNKGIKRSNRYRRHCISKSYRMSCEDIPIRCPTDSITQDEHNDQTNRILSKEEHEFDWDELITALFQLIQALIYYGYIKDDSLIKSLQNPLFNFYSLYSYINRSGKCTFLSKNIVEVLRDILETNCHLTLIEESIAPIPSRFSGITESKLPADSDTVKRYSRHRMSLKDTTGDDHFDGVSFRAVDDSEEL